MKDLGFEPILKKNKKIKRKEKKRKGKSDVLGC